MCMCVCVACWVACTRICGQPSHQFSFQSPLASSSERWGAHESLHITNLAHHSIIAIAKNRGWLVGGQSCWVHFEHVVCEGYTFPKKKKLSPGRRGIPCHHSYTICSVFYNMCNPPARHAHFPGPGLGWLAAWLAWLGGAPPPNPVMLDNGVGQWLY